MEHYLYTNNVPLLDIKLLPPIDRMQWGLILIPFNMFKNLDIEACDIIYNSSTQFNGLFFFRIHVNGVLTISVY